MDVDLSAISSNSGIGPWVTEQAFKVGAAQVQLILSGDLPGVTSGGLAWLGSSSGAPVGAGTARSVVLWQRNPSSYRTVAHELSHNFGCSHDRLNASGGLGGVTGATDGDGRYNYGQLWRYQSTVTTYTIPAGSTRQDFPNGNVTFTRPDGSKVYTYSRDMGYAAATISSPDANGVITAVNTYYHSAGTIMSYATGIIPYFSNPSITLHVTSASYGSVGSLDWGTVPLGYAATDPKAAHNAKILTDAGSAMSAYGAGLNVPEITSQPQNTSVANGVNCSFSVTATGGGLTYQWFKDGTSVAGATTERYNSVASAAIAGSYTVTCTNSKGSVTSSAATLTVTTAVTPPPSSGGSGGGGGGAPSPLFLGILAVLAGTRLLRSRRGLSLAMNLHEGRDPRYQ